MKLQLGKIKSKSGLILGKKGHVKGFRLTKELDDNLWDMGRNQTISSAKTSRKQISAANKKINWETGTKNIDIGGGKFEDNTEYLKSKGVDNRVFDPFNRGKKHNEKVLRERFRNGGYDTATNHNVLNVIQEPTERSKVLKQIKQSLKKDGKAHLSVYEGDGSGLPKNTRDGWQNNRKTKDYLREVEDVFGTGNVLYDSKTKIITARKFSESLFLIDF